jgi:hypothetical protein
MANITHHSTAKADGMAQNQQTAPRNNLLNAIDNTLANRDIPTNGPFRVALEEQSKIGWLGMLWGYWANTWQQESATSVHQHISRLNH